MTSLIAMGAVHLCTARKAGVRCCVRDQDEDFSNGALVAPKLDAFRQLSEALDVSSFSDHTCALTKSNGVMCWGSNEYQQLVSKSGDEPGSVHSIPTRDAVQVSAGDAHACVLDSAGAVACWGDNRFGQAGLPRPPQHAPSDQRAVYPPVMDSQNPGVRFDEPAIQVSAGYGHTCVVLEGGGVRCWGENRTKELGFPDDVTGTPDKNVTLPGPAAQVAAGSSATCALLRDGTVHCWGSNSEWVLCTGAVEDTYIPRQIPLPARALRIALNEGRGCALLKDGRVACWGRVALDAQGSCEPLVINLAKAAVGVAVGSEYSCALHRDESVSCWGINGTVESFCPDSALR